MPIRVVLVVGMLALGSLLVAPCLAWADAAGLSSAREHYRKATQLYDLQRYLEAAHEYELAYQSKEDPALLFNIGQSYRLGKQWASALGAFRSFLRNVPNAPNRAQVEVFITEAKKGADEDERVAAGKAAAAAEQEKIVAEQARLAAERERLRLADEEAARAAAAAATQVRREPDLVEARRQRKLKLAGIGVAAGGGALLVVGGVMMGLAGSTANKYNDASMPTQFVPSDQTKVHTFRNVGIAMLAVGGVAAVAGTALAVVGSRKERAARLVWNPSVGIGYAGLDVGGVW